MSKCAKRVLYPTAVPGHTLEFPHPGFPSFMLNPPGFSSQYFLASSLRNVGKAEVGMLGLASSSSLVLVKLWRYDELSGVSAESASSAEISFDGVVGALSKAPSSAKYSSFKGEVVVGLTKVGIGSFWWFGKWGSRGLLGLGWESERVSLTEWSELQDWELKHSRETGNAVESWRKRRSESGDDGRIFAIGTNIVITMWIIGKVWNGEVRYICL